MAAKDGGARFGTVSILNHWVIAVLIIAMLALGLYMADLPRGPDKSELIQLHKSVGVLILLLGAWRVLWRIWIGFPEDVAAMPVWQRHAARAVHIVLLIAVLAMPISGYVMSSAGGHKVSFFNVFDLPALPENKAVSGAAGFVHEWLGYLVIAILFLHVLAAVKHHVVDKDATLRRMIGRMP